MDDKKLYNYVDSGNTPHTVEFKENDFELVQVDKSIHDTKFKSKPTTFFKDALKRFSKNKASVAGAIILGTLLLCSFIVPLADTNDIYTARGDEQFLPSKLFPFGTGFWDGSRKYENAVADPNNPNNPEGKMLPGSYESNGSVVKFEPQFISNLSTPKQVKTNSPTIYGNGGTLLLRGKKIRNTTDGLATDEEFLNEAIYQYYSPQTNIDLSKDYLVNIDVDEDYKLLSDEILTTYSLSLAYGKTKSPDSIIRVKPNIPLTEYVSDDLTINISEVLNNLPEESKPEAKELENASLVFNVKPSFESRTVLPIKNVITVSEGQNVRTMSIENPCYTLATRKESVEDYWKIYTTGDVGSTALRDATCYHISFTYDAYGAVYGLKSNVYFGASELEKYTSKGLLPADFVSEDAADTEKYIGLDLYKDPIDGVLYDKTPIRYVTSYKEESRWNEEIKDYESFYQANCTVQKYKLLGYDKEPIFIFGTDRQGHDIFKKAFVGLRSSLLLGIAAAGVCFLFGLCYGAVEGYFGGTVDIVMQRFTDILSGVPWIVIMTLMIIKFGNKPMVFAAALCLTGWIGIAGLTRTQFYRFRGREYILASRTLGANDGRLIFRHILPNAMGTIITSSVLMIPSIIFQEATISYLGLGLKGQNYVSLGVILSNNQQYLQTYPNLLIVPAVIIALLMISFNLFGNGLRDAFNPSLKGSE